MMKAQILLCFFATALFISCKKEDRPEEPPSGGTKLTKLVTTAGSSTETTFLTYDADGKLASWRQTESGGGSSSEEGFRIQRKAGGMIDKVVFIRSGFSDSVTLVVNSSGTQYTNAQWFQKNFGNTEVRRTTFVYDNAGNIAEVTTTDLYNGQPDPKDRLNYTYTNGNLTAVKSYRISGSANDLVIQHDSEYDQKPNPLASGADWIVLTATGMLFGPNGSVNNITKHAIKPNGLPEIIIVTAYTYNDKGLPLISVQKREATGQVVATSTYTYE
ncbi:MAG: hypothetical protein M3Q06_04990 [Bacteroidota bacterium]|nr:hypothetical protein [Bacteroidota bacterium]